MKQSWDFELAEKTAFTYCLTKAAIHFNIKFKYLIKFYLQSFISNLINVCVKHIPISQKDGQKLNVVCINKIQDFLQKSEKSSVFPLIFLRAYFFARLFRERPVVSKVFG